MATHYLRLNIGARMRLAALRAIAFEWNKAGPPRTWQQLRHGNFKSSGEDNGRLQFRRHQYAHFIGRGLKSRGWFTNSDCTETLTGMVANISHGRWIAGYEESMSDFIVWDRSQVFTDENEAAQQADEMARIAAENEREHNDRFDEAQNMQFEIESKLSEVRELRDSHSATMLAAVLSGNLATATKRRDACARMRRDVSVLHATITALRDDLATNYRDVL